MPEGPIKKLILMGTGPFAVPTFDALRQAGYEIGRVYTRPIVMGPHGKPAVPSPVRTWATEHQLPLEDPLSINTPEAIEQLGKIGADLLVVCDYGQILKRGVLEQSRRGGINLHGSLLPAFRGAAPVQWAIWSGAKRTGVSVILMTPRLDGGPLLAVQETEILAKETAGDLEPRLAQLGVSVVLQSLKVLDGWDGESTIGLLQDESQVSQAPRLSKAHGKIDWSHPAWRIDCQVRALQPWPLAWFVCQPLGKPEVRVVIKCATVVSQEGIAEMAPGKTVSSHPEWIVATGEGLLRLDRIQPAGKREMTAAEFLRGNPLPLIT
jgi:methionyl-tRNA formyltransferase